MSQRRFEELVGIFAKKGLRGTRSECTHVSKILEIAEKVGTHRTIATKEAGEETRGPWGGNQNIREE